MNMTTKVKTVVGIMVSNSISCVGFKLMKVNTIEAEVVPLQSYGVMDLSGMDINNHEVFANAMRNLSRSGEENYVVRRGGFVNEYPRVDEHGQQGAGDIEHPNYFLGAFPCLFPYDQGGFEVDRPWKLSYVEQARWALRYADKRFRLDVQFVFQIFGIMQKREVCWSTCLQIKKEDFCRNEEAIQGIDAGALLQASREESEKKPISNVAVKALKRHVSAVRTKVIGTDESRRGE